VEIAYAPVGGFENCFAVSADEAIDVSVAGCEFPFLSGPAIGYSWRNRGNKG